MGPLTLMMMFTVILIVIAIIREEREYWKRIDEAERNRREGVIFRAKRR